jgi:molybdenum cofactor cytidylyltransferase
MDKGPVAGIILAAGMSKRFGKTKQLHELGGSTILSWVIDASIRSDLDTLFLVLGHESEAVKASLGDRLADPRLSIVVNPDYAKGMSTSLQAGLRAARDGYPSIMVLMGDQPLLSPGAINHILLAFKSSDMDICASVHGGKRVLPVCISNRFYDEIFKVRGDMGAREIIKNNPEAVLPVDMEGEGGFIDIDCREDLEFINSYMGLK